MNQTAEMERPKIGLHVVRKDENAREQRLLERSIDARLLELEAVVADLVDAAVPLFRAEKNGIRETWEELAVKEATLRWIVRVAKHSEGRVRERLLLDVENALEDLERTADGIVRSAPGHHAMR
jgi:hypothetical protein